MLTASTATATALTIHHIALLFMKTSKFVNNDWRHETSQTESKGPVSMGRAAQVRAAAGTPAQNDCVSGPSQTAMHGTAAVRSNAAFCSYPPVDLQSGKPLGRRSGSFRRT